ncbi:hypothetical protein OC846_002271 [Tilletia horrida]|uniref:Uncharacterized protein n=1 Tax=Tilletia horrida TaxID=155126 RepID=A0AAN6JZ41_9BASI|nr:hypothetical protein OC846_002271 [Tilletia horrida]KAK0568032.1 hypothetical protein OC861_002347 [Tilletia horrida]
MADGSSTGASASSRSAMNSINPAVLQMGSTQQEQQQQQQQQMQIQQQLLQQQMQMQVQYGHDPFAQQTFQQQPQSQGQPSSHLQPHFMDQLMMHDASLGMPDFSSMSPEQLEAVIKNAFQSGAMGSSMASTGLALGSLSTSPNPASSSADPTGLMMAVDTGNLNNLPTFDFNNMSAGLLGTAAVFNSQSQMGPSLQHEVLQGHPGSSSSSAVTASSISALPSAMIAPGSSNTMPRQSQFAPSMHTGMNLSQPSDPTAGWQMFTNSVPQSSGSAYASPTFVDAPPLLHLSQTLPTGQPHHSPQQQHTQQQEAQMQYLAQPSLQQPPQQQQNASIHPMHSFQTHLSQPVPVSPMPTLQHHHSFHNLPGAQQQQPQQQQQMQPQQPQPLLDSTMFGTGHSLSQGSDFVVMDHTLHSHQSLPQLNMHFAMQQEMPPSAYPPQPQQQQGPSSTFLSPQSQQHQPLQQVQASNVPNTPLSSVVSGGSNSTSIGVGAGGGAPSYVSAHSGPAASDATGGSTGLSMGMYGSGLMTPMNARPGPSSLASSSVSVPASAPAPLSAPAQHTAPAPTSAPLPKSGGAVRSRPSRSVSAGMAGHGHAHGKSISSTAGASSSRSPVAGSGSGMSLSQPLRDLLSSSRGRAVLEQASKVRNERVQQYDEVAAALDTLRLYLRQGQRSGATGSTSSSSAGGSSLSSRNTSSVNRSGSAGGGGQADLSMTSKGSTNANSSRALASGTGSSSHIIGLGLGFPQSKKSAASPGHRRTSSSRHVSASTAANTSGASGSARAGIGNSSVLSALSSAGTLASTSTNTSSSVRSDASKPSLAPSASSNLNKTSGAVGPGSSSSSISVSPNLPSHGHGHSRTRSRRASSSLNRSYSGDVQSTLSDPAPAGAPYPSPYAHLHPHSHGKAHGYQHRHSGTHSSPGLVQPVDEQVEPQDEQAQIDEDPRLGVLDDISERVSRMRAQVQLALAEAAAAVAAAEEAEYYEMAEEGDGPAFSGDGAGGRDLVEPPG